MRSAFRVIHTVREKHACKKCDRIVQAPAPSRPIERGITGPRVLTSKYAEHTPVLLLPGSGKMITARLWTYMRNDRKAGSVMAPVEWFAYSPDAKRHLPADAPYGFSGVVQADPYARINEVYRRAI